MPESAFEELLVPQLDRAFAIARGLTRDRDQAQNLVQEGALRALSSFHTFRPGTNFRAWFFRIVTNCFFESCRKTNRRQETQPGDLDLFLYHQASDHGWLQAENPAQTFLGQFDLEQIQQAFDQLPEEFRVVAAMYFQGDFAYAEISHLLQLPLGTVRSRLHRARRLLQKALWQVALDHGLQIAGGPGGGAQPPLEHPGHEDLALVDGSGHGDFC